MRRWLVPAGFAVMALVLARSAVVAVASAAEHPALQTGLVAVYDALKTALTLCFCAFTIGRPAPRRHSRDTAAFLTCTVAIFSLMALAAPPANVPGWLVVMGEGIAVIASAWLIFAIRALRRCFGVLPEARGLVTHGPYRLVRHPIYLGELAASAGLAAAAPGMRNALVFGVFAAAQLARMRLEEHALTQAFPEYKAYAAMTPRLIPRISIRPGIPAAVPRPARAGSRGA